MSSGFSAGRGDGNCDPNFNPQVRPPLFGSPPASFGQNRNPEFVAKRPLSEFLQNQSDLGFYLRNVKMRPNSDSSPIPSVLPCDASISNQRTGIPYLQQNQFPNGIYGYKNGHGVLEDLRRELEKKMLMKDQIKGLEKLLMEDELEGTVSEVTIADYTNTIQNLIGPAGQVFSAPSPSSCTTTCGSPPVSCAKQTVMDAATAISEGKLDAAAEIITGLQQFANSRGTPVQRLIACMVSSLRSRVNPPANPPLPLELYSNEHKLSIQILYTLSPCFALGFMAANLAILDAASKRESNQIHVVDIDIGHGRQYHHLISVLASKKPRATALKVTALLNYSSLNEKQVNTVGEKLKTFATKFGVAFNFSVKKLSTMSRENLGINPDETLAVNLAHKLHTLPDESVANNLRDGLLRCVKSLSPAAVTVVEEEFNGNTAPLTVRVREAYDHYGALFDSLDATAARDSEDRVMIESALGRKIRNSVALEGRDRVERCELFGKWRSRMIMAGFEPLPIYQSIAEPLRVKLNSMPRGNPGFTVSDQLGAIGFGWKERILTVTSAWR